MYEATPGRAAWENTANSWDEIEMLSHLGWHNQLIRNVVESSHLDRVFAREESEQPMLLAPKCEAQKCFNNSESVYSLYTICTITKLRPGTGKCPHDQKISEDIRSVP